MIGSLLVMVLAAGDAAEMEKFQEKTLTLQVPADWEQSEEEGTHRFQAPSGDAYFLLDVNVKAKATKASACLDKILEAMGEGDWDNLKAGGSPAAKSEAVDEAPEGKGTVETVTYVGCDGKTAWSLVFHVEGTKKDEYAPLISQVVKSLKYAKKSGGK